MANKDYKDILKANTPEMMRGYEDLDGFLNAIGDFFNETEEFITSFDYSHDYEKSTDYGLDQSLKSIGFELPALTDKKISRVVLRDAVQAFIRKGTTQSLEWVLKVIGVEPVIRQGWLPSPDEVADGYIVDPVSGVKSRYDVSRYTYTDLLYGEAERLSNGTFLHACRYDDPTQDLPVGYLPIIGEYYKTQPTYITPVIKTPYIVIRIANENFNVATGPYTENGIEYEYGLTEEYEAIVNIIEYFLYASMRPANVRILLVASVQNISETVNISETYQDLLYDGTPLIFYEMPNVQDVFLDEIPIDVATVNVGDPILIGSAIGSPYQNAVSVIDLNIGDLPGTYILRHIETFNEVYGRTFVSNLAGQDYSRKIPNRYGLFVTLTAPSDTQIAVYGLDNFSDAHNTGTLIDTLNSSETKQVEIPNTYHAYYFSSPTSTDFSNLEVDLHYTTN